ncbi:MAG: C/D box methylation guide ribonucleoprotein complex aNOP56 subunit [Candidatus Bathyarchaeia archaeon]
MKVYVADTVLGLFIIDGGGGVLDWERFEDVEEAAESMVGVDRGLLSRPLGRLLPRLRSYELIVTDNPGVMNILQREGLKVELVKSSDVIRGFRGSLAEYALKEGLISSIKDLDELERKILYEMAKIRVRGVSARRDLYAAQMIRALDDIDKSINVFSGRIREWYGLHFPELDKMVDSHELYAKLVLKMGRRSGWSVEALNSIGITGGEAERLLGAAANSMGGDISDEDLEVLRSFCRATLELYDLRGEIALSLERAMMESTPNLASVIGPTIAARLISLAGGIDNLAKMPASTIQVLGAEKALFRALRTGSRPPKHGVIFQYAPLHQSPRWQRGKIARALAAKIAIAARLDAYNGEFRGGELREDLERRIAEIRSRYKSPPRKVKRRGGRGKGKTT